MVLALGTAEPCCCRTCPFYLEAQRSASRTPACICAPLVLPVHEHGDNSFCTLCQQCHPCFDSSTTGGTSHNECLLRLSGGEPYLAGHTHNSRVIPTAGVRGKAPHQLEMPHNPTSGRVQYLDLLRLDSLCQYCVFPVPADRQLIAAHRAKKPCPELQG